MGFAPISMMRIALLAVLATPILVAASETIAYCSSQNTGSSFSANVSTFQSYGLCKDTCNEDYAYAILQEYDCWCSNYAPSDTTDTSDCSDGCPGYGSDKCGNTSKGLYVYYQMSNVAPSGTVSASSSTTASKTQASTVSSAVPETETVTITASDSQSSTIVTVSSSSSTSTLSTSSSSTETSSTTSSSTSTGTTTKPTLSVQTVAGQAVTVTVQNPSSTGTASADSTSHRHSSLSGGAIAGVVIGSLAGAGILLALLFWFCYARRRPGSSAGSYDASIQGTLLDGRRHSKGSQMSMMRNIPSSPGGPTAFTDSRMNKEATLYPNGARLSNISLQDNQDYSRPVLRLTNPD